MLDTKTRRFLRRVFFSSAPGGALRKEQ